MKKMRWLKKMRWFKEGAAAWRAHVDHLGLAADVPAGEWYACPLCTDMYDADELEPGGGLTLEHVPPEAVGGKELLLTCQPCNNKAGHTIDAEADRFERMRRFLTGEPTEPVQGTLRADEVEVNAWGHATPGGIVWSVVEGHVDPRQLEPLKRAIGRMHSETGEVQISVTTKLRVDDADVARSWIRSAYLATFALLGWPYIARPVFAPIRYQLAPDADTPPPENYLFDVSSAQERRQFVLFVDEPADCRCVIVHWHGHVVVLPPIRGNRPLAEIMASIRSHKADDEARGERSVLAGEMAPWPTSPTYSLPYP